MSGCAVNRRDHCNVVSTNVEPLRLQCEKTTVCQVVTRFACNGLLDRIARDCNALSTSKCGSSPCERKNVVVIHKTSNSRLNCFSIDIINPIVSCLPQNKLVSIVSSSCTGAPSKCNRSCGITVIFSFVVSDSSLAIFFEHYAVNRSDQT